ncbi:MAG: hypothetical protein JRJ29_17995 [Deltaproteobacteria bacterium]|nr:hypothetical protein [Deltaproteobacteria bacterium]
MPFINTWNALQTQLTPGTVIRNWTAQNGFLGDEFTIVSVSQNYIEVDTPRAQNIQRIPQRDFQIVYNLWDDYRLGNIRRHEIRDQTRFSKYIISILHWLQNNCGGQLA